jgi:hypothetical protein
MGINQSKVRGWSKRNVFFPNSITSSSLYGDLFESKKKGFKDDIRSDHSAIFRFNVHSKRVQGRFPFYFF